MREPSGETSGLDALPPGSESLAQSGVIVTSPSSEICIARMPAWGAPGSQKVKKMRPVSRSTAGVLALGHSAVPSGHPRMLVAGSKVAPGISSTGASTGSPVARSST